jgi:tyrosyl-tRNA synthetase
VQKMSKSLNNYIGITDAPDDMFGKIMSVSDELMWRYFELLSFRPMSDIASMKAQVNDGANPRDIKFKLAAELIERFHSRADAERAQQNFIERFQKGAMPDEMDEITLDSENGEMGIAALLSNAGLVKSNGEGFRMIKQGAVKIDGEKVSDQSLSLAAGFTGVVQVGKRRFARVTLK